MCSYYSGWPSYVSVAEMKAQAAKQVARLKKKGMAISPIVIDGRKIAKTFWGKSWCANLEAYSDVAHRLPRGRSYVRNGSVVHLEIGKAKIHALVNGSSLYKVNITIKALEKGKWEMVVNSCSGSIGSLVELLQGKFSKSVMEIITHKERGLFPTAGEMKLKCDCPDHAIMCKHVAAVLYGIGARLDSQPELLFLLRQTDHLELLTSAALSATLDQENVTDVMNTSELSALFGIDIDEIPTKSKPTHKDKAKPRAKTKKAPVKKGCGA